MNDMKDLAVIIFTEGFIFCCLQQYDNKKSNELYAAIKLKKLLEKLSSGDYRIGLVIKREFRLKHLEGGQMTREEFNLFLGQEVEEDDSIDVVLRRRRDEHSGKQEYYYQIKRFGLGKWAPCGTDKLTQFFEYYRIKFAAQPYRSLVVTAFNTNASEPIEYGIVTQHLEESNHPCSEVILMQPYRGSSETAFRYVRLMPKPVNILDIDKKEMIESMTRAQPLDAMCPKDFVGGNGKALISAFEKLDDSLMK